MLICELFATVLTQLYIENGIEIDRKRFNWQQDESIGTGNS